MGLQLVITDAGRARVVDQASGGFRAVRIARVGLSPAALAATPVATALPGELKRVDSLAGEATAPDVVHLTVVDESVEAYTLRSFALYLDDGTLFALYGQPDPIVEKSAQALLLLALDVTLVDLPAAAITFGPANFTNPAATEARAGVVKLATAADAEAGTDRQRALTPQAIAGVYAKLSGAAFAGDVGVHVTPSTPLDVKVSNGTRFHVASSLYRDAPRLYAANAADDAYRALELQADGWYLVNASGTLVTVLRADGGLDTAGAITRAGNLVWDAGNDGAGSGLDADLLDGRDGEWYADAAARLGYQPANRAGDHFDGVVGIGVVPQTPLDIRVSNGSRLHVLSGAYVSGPRIYAADDDDTHYRPIELQANGYYFLGPTGKVVAAMIGDGRLDVAGAITRGGQIVWDAGNDGAGSGLDADLLDGRHADAFAAAAHTHAAADLAGAFAGSLTDNGYTVLPNGLILQWLTGAQQAAGSSGSQVLTLPVTFPNRCLHASVSTTLAGDAAPAGAFYFVTAASNAKVTVQRQAFDHDLRASTPVVLAIGY